MANHARPHATPRHPWQMRSDWVVALLLQVLAAGCAADPQDNANSNDNGAPGIQLSPTRQAVAIVDPPGFTTLLDKSQTETTTTLQPLVEDYVRLFAKQFSTDVDFIIFTLDAHRDALRFNAVGGFNITLRVPEAGLGPFVAIPDFSTLPNLRSYIYLARKDALVLGPLLHELAHGWGVRYRLPPALGAQAEASNNHWGYSSVGGQMGGWMPGALVDLGDGAFELSLGNVEVGGRSFNTVPYAALEMYLMGLAPAQTVRPIEVALNPDFKSLFEFTADGIVEVTIDEIIAANGARVPDFEEAQRHFKLALMVLADHELDEAEWRFYQDSIDYFAFAGPMDIEAAFPQRVYAGQPIRELILQPDPEDASRRFLNFFEATAGQATVEFVALSRLSDPAANQDP